MSSDQQTPEARWLASIAAEEAARAEREAAWDALIEQFRLRTEAVRRRSAAGGVR